MIVEEVFNCPFCGKEYGVVIVEQEPGFRFMEEEVCPYCHKVIRTSMEFEFTTYERCAE